jgi:hypothetical protein
MKLIIREVMGTKLYPDNMHNEDFYLSRSWNHLIQTLKEHKQTFSNDK